MTFTHAGRVFVVLVLLVSPGCSKEKFNELADKAKAAVTEQAEKVKEQAGVAKDAAKETLALAGNFELDLDAPMTTSACYVEFIQQGSGRPNVLRMRSYRDAAKESFPSVMFHAPITAGGVSELVGQTIPGQLFVQKEANAPTWSCASGTNVEVKIVSVADKVLSAEIVGGAVVSSQSGADQPVTGKITGVIQ
jgi:hypothetical protein